MSILPVRDRYRVAYAGVVQIKRAQVTSWYLLKSRCLQTLHDRHLR